MRLTFCIVSLIVFMQYATTLFCRVKSHHWKQHNFEQKSVLGLSFMLFLFNDPWYVVHIFNPTIVTSILN